jgi:hypothetical protein
MSPTEARRRAPAIGFACCLAWMLLGPVVISCSAQPPAEKAPPPDDPIASLPAEIRAQVPPTATLREVIAGRGTIVPPGEAGESHQRHAYDLPSGAAGIVAVVRWTDAAWPDVEIAIGIGLCPHRGRELESARGSRGSAALHHAVQADEALAEDKWFLHVNGDAGLAANPGKSLPYTYAVYSY